MENMPVVDGYKFEQKNGLGGIMVDSKIYHNGEIWTVTGMDDSFGFTLMNDRGDSTFVDGKQNFYVATPSTDISNPPTGGTAAGTGDASTSGTGGTAAGTGDASTSGTGGTAAGTGDTSTSGTGGTPSTSTVSFNDYIVASDSHDYTTSYKDYSKIDFDSSIDLARSWNTMVASAASQIPKAVSNIGFQALNSANLDNGFPPKFDQSVENLFSGLLVLDNSILSSLDSLLAADEAADKGLPGGRGKGGSDETERTVSSPTTQTLVNNSNEQLLAYKNISLSDLSGIADELTKLADSKSKTLEELLSDKTYSQDIQSLLLNTQHISDDLKELIYKGEVEISQSILFDIFSGKNQEMVGINENTILTLKQHLNGVANSNNLSYDNLIQNESNAGIIKKSLLNFSGVTSSISNLKDDSIVNDLLNIYDGNNVDNMESSTVGIFRNHMENVANSNNTNVETSVSSANFISEVKNLGKMGVFLSNLNGYSDSSVISILQMITKQ